MPSAARRIASLLACLSLGALATISLAHEFWLQADALRVPAGATVKISTMVGDGFPGESRPRDPTKLDRFEIAGGGAAAQPILGIDGNDPAGIVQLAKPGTYAVGYRSRNTMITLDGPKFDAYLKEEGLDNALEARKGKSDVPGRERYSRCAKTLISVGDDRGSGFDHSFGFPLELIPTQNPYALAAGDGLTVTLLADGKPAANALVRATNRDHPGEWLSERTNDQGQVTFKLDQPGFWMIASVRMTAVEPPAPDCDWESLWATLTFDLTPSKNNTR
ncbi:MAG TPA: DUF4198 domain-containing protein [Phycisphaerales bacterium]